MRGTILLIVLLLASFTIALNETLAPYVSDFANFRIDSLKYEPYPVEPGKYFTLWIKAENFGNVDAEDFSLEFVDNYPFSLQPSQEHIRNLGKVGSLDQVVMEFKIYTDENAVPGDNEIKVKFTDDGTTWVSKEIIVNVQSPDAILSIEKVENPELEAGSSKDLIFRLKNLNSLKLKNIKVSMDLDPRVVGTNLIEYPFGIIGSGKTKTIESILPGKEKELTFTIKADNDATSGIYKVPVTISYLDALDKEYSSSELVSVVIMSNPNIEVIIESTEITKGKLAGEVLIKVINKGLGDIRFLTLNLKENDNFQVLSQSNSVYIGNLESDDFDTASFKIRINSLSEKVEIPVFLNYRSDNNELSEYSASLELKMFGEEELNDPKNNNALIILILVIVVVVSGVIYRKKKL